MPEVPLDFPRQWVEFVDPADPDQLIRADLTWLTSRWVCIFGRGCAGIDAQTPDAGCCVHGAHFSEKKDQKRVTHWVDRLDDGLWQKSAIGRAKGWVVREDGSFKTRVVDGACIFLNRPGFPGGTGCALHRAAIDADESPIEWKPSVCWQLPIRIDWEQTSDTTERATLRRWSRVDWGDEGETRAWCCTEGDRAYVGERPVIESLADELVDLLGSEVYVELKRRLDER